MLLLAEFVHMILEVVGEIFVAVCRRLFRWGDDPAKKVKTPTSWIVNFFRISGLIALGLILFVGVAWVRAQGWWPFS